MKEDIATVSVLTRITVTDGKILAETSTGEDLSIFPVNVTEAGFEITDVVFYIRLASGRVTESSLFTECVMGASGLPPSLMSTMVERKRHWITPEELVAHASHEDAASAALIHHCLLPFLPAESLAMLPADFKDSACML